MTTAEMLPISEGRAKQITDFLKTPRTPEELARSNWPSWYKNEPESTTSRAQDLLDQLCEQGRARKTEDGKYEAVPENEEPRDESGEEINANGAQPTGGAAESDSTEGNEMTTTEAPKRRGRPKKTEAASNGHGKPAAAQAPPPAAKPKAQGSLTKNEEIRDHLGAIDRVEQELAAAKIGYEDFLNIRRMKRAALDVAKSERRRYSVHEGSGLEAIKSAQKAVDKATKQYNEAAANALEGKNKVASIEEKLSRTIAGEMPLFNEGEEAGDDDE